MHMHLISKPGEADGVIGPASSPITARPLPPHARDEDTIRDNTAMDLFSLSGG